MQFIVIGFFLGIVLLMQCSSLPDHHFLWLLALTFPLAAHRRSRFLCFILLGFFWAWFRAEWVLQEQLAPALEGQAIEVVGEIVSLPETKPYGERVIFRISEDIVLKQQRYPSPGRLRLSWRNPDIPLQPGQRWRCRVKLKRPMGFANPGGFDYEFWLFHQRIRATGYVLEDSCVLLGTAAWPTVQTLRYRLRQQLRQSLDDPQTLALLSALLLGDKSSINSEQWQTLQRTGTNHLLAISGLHIGLVFGLTLFVSRRLLAFSGTLISRVPASRVSLWLGLAAAGFYAALAGFSLPTQRAMIMLSVSVLAIACYRKLAVSNIVAVSLFVVLLIDPFAVATPGFWLSFMAVIIILFGMCYRVQNHGLWWQWGRTQYLVTLGLFPLVFFWFQTQAPYGFFANIIAIPLVSFVVVPFLLGFAVLIELVPQAAALALALSELGLQCLWQYLSFVGQLEAFSLPVSTTGLLPLLLAMLAVLWFLLPRGFPAKHLSVVLLLPMLFLKPRLPDETSLSLQVLDVGQGLAVVVQTAGKTLVYDTGPKYSPQFDTGAAVVVPLLRQAGVNHIDKLLISHGDNDHIGGLNSVLAAMPVGSLLLNQSAPSGWGGRQIPCNRQQNWQWGASRFQILHPGPDTDLGKLDRNQSSCVLKISLFDSVILLTGDIDRLIEQQLLYEYGQQLASTLLLVPHHGSKSSSSEAFLRAVAPNYAIVASGYRNRFGFPKQVIMQRYAKHDVTVLNTANSGMIAFRVTKNGLSYSTYRQSHRRFWHTVP